jgi:hypothetical protein
MKLVDHIAVFENFVPKEFCSDLINTFEYFLGKQMRMEEDMIISVPGTEDRLKLKPFKKGETQFQTGDLERKDIQLFMEGIHPDMAEATQQFVGDCFEQYIQVYQGLIKNVDPVSSWSCKVQRTDPGGGFHRWHCESGDFLYRDRVLTWMIYLNDIPVENGGGTDFLYQKLSLQPTIGTVVLWPAGYTHMHRGSFLTGDTQKYIATGWFDRESGNKNYKNI